MYKADKRLVITSAIMLGALFSSTNAVFNLTANLKETQEHIKSQGNVIKKLNVELQGLKASESKKDKTNSKLQESLKSAQEEIKCYRKDISFNASNVREISNISLPNSSFA